MMRTRIACTVMVWLASTSIGLAEWSENQDLSYLVGDAQFFAPRDLSTFDEKPYANEGFFFTADLLNWRVSAPEWSTIGKADYGIQVVLVDRPQDTEQFSPWLLGGRIQSNIANTREFDDERQTGQEYSIGYIEGGHGWSVRGFDMHGVRQNITATDSMVAFADPEQLLVLGLGADNVPLGVLFDDLQADLRTQFWSVEANYIHRKRLHYGDYLECFCGPRMFMFQESFGVRGYGGVLDDSVWYTDAHNYIVGPQIGFRYFKRYSSWQFNVEGRGMAALNFQDIRQQSTLASQGGNAPLVLAVTDSFPFIFPPSFQTLSPLQSHSDDRLRTTQFSPVLEFKAEATYIVTKGFSIKAGYSATFVGGLARPTSMVDYTFPQMGILNSENEQVMIAHGLNLGLEFNH